ncbi:MAG: GH116 family glycosyl hydrolase [Candidatus Latescibacterota bacterium]
MTAQSNEKTRSTHNYNESYTGSHLDRIAFPLGGIGAGMICLEGTAALSHVSLRNVVEVYHEPNVFAALCVKGESHVARVLEGPVPNWKVFGPVGTGNGASGKNFGLPRFSQAEFRGRFPFGQVKLVDPKLPVSIEITGWSPFIPGDADSSSLPVAGLEYRIVNDSPDPIEAVFSFHAENFMATAGGDSSVGVMPGGFVLQNRGSEAKPWDEGSCSITTDDPSVLVNGAWFRGGWWDPLTMVWKSVAQGRMIASGPPTSGGPSPGGSLYVPVNLESGGEQIVRVRLAWYVPATDLRVGTDPACADGCECVASDEEHATHVPWYAGRFAGIEEVTGYWSAHYERLRADSMAFSECFFDTTLPSVVVEAISANLSILKSPTVFRQTDGRLWCWEGCGDHNGCCHGSCTHVWNYAQALPHLFPELERSLRETEFGVSQDARGHQTFRTNLPIRPTTHEGHAASDGQLGGVMKVYREWRISGDTDWLRALWPKVRQSLDYCMATWDPDHKGILEEPHHNTYDIEFWGPDGMGTSFYLGALTAASEMAEALGESVPLYQELLIRGRRFAETTLWNGEFFMQQVVWKGLRAKDPASMQSVVPSAYSEEAFALLEKEGPKYQYGSGCLSDGVLGEWIAQMCGVGGILDPVKVESHLVAVHAHNFRPDLSEHANPQRPSFALGREAGLLLCSWPHGGEPTLPFVYSDEVWTGIEYQVASHLMLTGHVGEGLEIVRAARDRYDGRVRNPFNEYECGHWYARAMASYGLIQGLTGVRYDAVDKVLHLSRRIPGDFRAFLSTATGYGTVGLREGQPFLEVRHGAIAVERTDYSPYENQEEIGPEEASFTQEE